MMLSKRWRGLTMMALAVTLTLAFALPAQAQRDTGIMNVQAIDPDGAPLPGVMVVARGPVGTQTQYTGVDGTARFPGLYPGNYTATFSLDGFKTIVREGLTIQAQRTTAFSMTMELASVEETVTVTGKSPVVDVKSANIAGLYSDDLIDKTPTASGIWAGVLDHVPGIVSSNDVGGGASGQQSTPIAWGSESTNNSYNVNGGDTTDPAATGASSSYFSTGSFEEVSVSLASQDIEIRTPGVNMNMVVKSGSNDWHAGVKYFYEGPSLVSSNVDAELEAQGITEGTPNELLSDLDIQGGGPIWKDRAWFFVDYWNFEIQTKVLGLTETDGTDLDDWTINLNGQVNDNNKISGRFIHTKKYRNNRGAGRDSPYLGWIQDSNTKIPQLQWQSVINQNIFSDVRYSTVRSNFPLVRRGPGTSEPDVPYQNWSATYDFFYGQYLPRPSNPTYEFFDERDTDNLNGTVSWYVTGEQISHDIKFGWNYTWINYFGPYNYPDGYRRYTRGNFDPMGNPNWMITFPDTGETLPAVPVEVRLYGAPIAGQDGGSPDCFVLN
ncbi:MAG: carboxypeptidase-like regulatory domain-containing protein, partial [Acidobacteriota bacterium]